MHYIMMNHQSDKNICGPYPVPSPPKTEGGLWGHGI